MKGIKKIQYFVRHFLSQDVTSHGGLWKLVRYDLSEKNVRKPDKEIKCLLKYWIIQYRHPFTVRLILLFLISSIFATV